MTSPFKYRPYVETQPFTIGLAPIPLARWIEPDDGLAAGLAAKDRILAEHGDQAVRLTHETQTAQAEVRDRLVAHLTSDHAALYVREGDAIRIMPTGALVAVPTNDPAPLLTAARLVQDDLVLMRRRAGAWHLAAAVLTAPSKWSLAEHFGRNLDGIHQRVPGYSGRMATMMARIFDSLQSDAPVARINWSLYDDDVLFHPETKAAPKRWSGSDGNFGAQAFVRVERQTLMRLPLSGDILFTIRVYVDPVAAFRTHPDGPAMARALGDRLAAMDDAQLAYKGLRDDRERIIAALAAIAELR